MANEKNVLEIKDSNGELVCELTFDDDQWNAIVQAAVQEWVVKTLRQVIAENSSVTVDNPEEV